MTKPVEQVDRSVTFTPPQIIEAVNTSYPDFKIPGDANVDIERDEGHTGIKIKWTEKKP